MCLWHARTHEYAAPVEGGLTGLGTEWYRRLRPDPNPPPEQPGDFAGSDPSPVGMAGKEIIPLTLSCASATPKLCWPACSNTG